MAAKKAKVVKQDPGPNVGYVREELADLQPRYDLIRDCVAGQEQVKKRREQYLPKPNAGDLSPENAARYVAYLCRAVFYGVTGRTLHGLLGQVFQKLPVVTLPPVMDVLKDDVDGGGVELNQQAQAALANVIQFGRAGLLTDYPITATPATKADQDAGKIRANILLYQPWDIINWRTITVGSEKLLSLVVISEQFVIDDDGFESSCEQQYRVLKLKDGTYWVEIWVQNEDEKVGGYVMDETFQPLNSNGQPWTYIPFTFIGSANNDSTPDLPPLYDLAELNIAHFRNSADYEESCYMVGQPTPVASGLTEEWVKDVLKGRLELGSRGVIMLPAGGSAELLQATANTMPMEAMLHKEAQMKALGAKLLEPGQVAQTATEASIESASETSILATCSNNVSKAYTKALQWAAEFVGAAKQTTNGAEDDSISFELSTDFEEGLTGADVPNVIAAWQAQAIAKEEMRDALKQAGVAYMDDEEYKQAIEDDGPNMGLPVDPNEAAAAEANAQIAAANAHAAVTGKPMPGKGAPPVAGKK